MKAESSVVSRMLVHDADPAAHEIIRSFCEENQLIAMRANNKSVLDLVRSNIELGAICLAEETQGSELAVEINRVRREIPIFMRLKNSASVDNLVPQVRSAIAGAYHLSEMNKLRELVNRYLFSHQFPNELVRGIAELTSGVLNTVFDNVEVSCNTPYVIRDKLIYGELFSLLHIDADWGRGYLMHQASEEPLIRFLQSGKTHFSGVGDFRSVNNLLSEIANLNWGKFKSSFVKEYSTDALTHRVQVPIIVNHSRKYITFGTDDPQLCFKYVISDLEQNLEPVTILQKFIFSLCWAPEKFQKGQKALDQLVNGGELEIF